MNWSTYILIALAAVALAAGLFVLWYKWKQHKYMHGVHGTPGYREIINPRTNEFQEVWSFPVSTPPKSFIDRHILMKKAKNVDDRVWETGKVEKLWIPRSFPDEKF